MGHASRHGRRTRGLGDPGVTVIALAAGRIRCLGERVARFTPRTADTRSASTRCTLHRTGGGRPRIYASRQSTSAAGRDRGVAWRRTRKWLVVASLHRAASKRQIPIIYYNKTARLLNATWT